jgi:hypothetical protein
MSGRGAAVVCGLVLAASLAVVIGLAAGPAGLAYAAVYALALVPGLPIGFALFGRRHAAGWIVGAALGYFLTAVALWLAIALRVPGAMTFTGAWALIAAVAWALTRGRGTPLVAAPAWTPRDTSALLVVLLLVPAIAGPPFIRLGAQDAAGNRYYRAYFTADFIWHMAVTAEVKKFTVPPRNVFMPLRPLHYYWSYFLLPGAVSGAGPRALASVENDLKVNAIGTATLFVSSIFIVAWLAVPRAWPVAAAVALTIVASSAEGAFAIVRLLRRGAPMAALRDLNIDAISNWWFSGLRVDALPRCFWWVPHHSAAYALGLAALALAAAAGSAAPLAAYWIAGLALAGCVAFNPFVGGVFCLVWGVAVLIDAVQAPDRVRRVLRCAVAVVPVAGAIAWCLATRMIGDASGILQWGLAGDARNSPLFNLALSLGPVLLPCAIGLVAVLGSPRPRALLAPGVLVLTSLAVMHFVRLRFDPSWVGFRAGQMILSGAPALVACGLVAAGAHRRVAAAVGVLALVVGLPTTAIDVYNAQDISNLRPAADFPWTEVVDRAQGAALEWVRRATPVTDTVQLDVIARGQTTWSIIPSFGERRMAAGTPRTMVDDPEYHERSERVRVMYATTSAQQARDLARALRIDYVWIDDVERAAYPSGMPKFESSPQFFAPAFKNSEVTVYRVQ